MNDDNKLGPCGEVCDVCDIKDECPITTEQWQTWLSIDVRNPESKDDACTDARKMHYMMYENEDGELMGWMDKLLVDCWEEMKRDDYLYRYPIPRDKLRPFLDDILKKNLTYRERQVVTMYLGLDTGRKLSFRQMGAYFNMSGDKLGQIHRDAIDKLKKAIIRDKRWRRRGPDGRFTAL